MARLAHNGFGDHKAPSGGPGESLQNAQNQLINAEKLAAIGKMAANVSHEIRNPLVTIGGFARRILRQDPSPQIKEAAQIIVSEVMRLERILDEVLDFSRPLIPHFSLNSVNKVTQESCLLIGEELKVKGIELSCHWDEDLPQIMMDGSQFKQALLNVLKNAISAMPSGGVLSVRTRRLKGHAKIEISDTGGGIPAGLIRKVFTPFFTTRSDGAGLGLALTRQIVQEHQGSIEITSKEGKGTNCEISLPVQRRFRRVLEREAVAGALD